MILTASSWHDSNSKNEHKNIASELLISWQHAPDIMMAKTSNEYDEADMGIADMGRVY